MDRKGVIGLPMRLAVAFLIIALFAPSLVSAAETFGNDADLADMEKEARKAEKLADDLWFAGKDSTGTVELRLDPGYGLRFGGEDADAWSYRITKGDSVVEIHYMETPDVRFLGDGFTAGGHCTLRMDCIVDDEGVYGISVAYA